MELFDAKYLFCNRFGCNIRCLAPKSGVLFRGLRGFVTKTTPFFTPITDVTTKSVTYFFFSYMDFPEKWLHRLQKLQSVFKISIVFN
mgnify:CR=1 FL=1